MTAPPPDPGRRLGERIPIGDVFMVWRATDEGDRRSRRSRKEPELARLLNVSVSGAAVVAPTATDLKRGSVLLVQFGNARAAVRVKRIEDFGEPDWRTYGVEFVETDPQFLDWISHVLAGRRHSDLIETWNHAH